ncbi:MAG TPA: PilZ domain-containing protein [Vicinamibacterales bacterium]|nr:PilZ domain-containing protein [Vicinamibacterales bacterium]
MVDGSTVLIGAAELLPALTTRLGSAGALRTFTDLQTLDAFNVIMQQRPRTVALDRVFAATSRGLALINRIKADPALGSVEVRIIAHDSDYTRRVAGPADAGGPTATAVAAVPAPPLDYRGTRRAPRMRMTAGLDVLVDGNPVALVDLSTIGAQVVSPIVLRPNQRVRVVLPEPKAGLRLVATVAWALFEIPTPSTARYRAGLQFEASDPAAPARIEAFCAQHAQP